MSPHYSEDISEHTYVFGKSKAPRKAADLLTIEFACGLRGNLRVLPKLAFSFPYSEAPVKLPPQTQMSRSDASPATAKLINVKKNKLRKRHLPRVKHSFDLYKEHHFSLPSRLLSA